MCWTTMDYNIHSANLMLMSLILIIMTSFVIQGDAARLYPLYWNSSNSLFKVSHNKHIIDVNIGDEIDFNCPYYPHHHLHHHGETPTTPDASNTQQPEFYTIYHVTKYEYDNCVLSPETLVSGKRRMVVNCNDPSMHRWFTVFIDVYSATPQLPDFRPGSSYYFITTSTGTHEGLDNDRMGACKHKNMKITLNVCCDETTPIGPPIRPHITPRAGPNTTTPTAAISSHTPTTKSSTPSGDLDTGCENCTSAILGSTKIPSTIHRLPTSSHRPTEDADNPWKPGVSEDPSTPSSWDHVMNTRKPTNIKTTKPIKDTSQNEVYDHPVNDQLVKDNSTAVCIQSGRHHIITTTLLFIVFILLR